MKNAIMPAQVTTKEDTITASLTFTQILLLVTPVLISAFIFVILPPWLKLNPLKLILALMFTCPLLLLAIRIRGLLVLGWIKLVGRYYLRPRIYCATVKNYEICSCHNEFIDTQSASTDEPDDQTVVIPQVPNPESLVLINGFLEGQKTSYKFNKEGKLNVFINKN